MQKTAGMQAAYTGHSLSFAQHPFRLQICPYTYAQLRRPELVSADIVA